MVLLEERIGKMLELMEEYPEYVFMYSQPQLYKYVKKNAQKFMSRLNSGFMHLIGFTVYKD